jgi:matrix metalloproteinase-14 (membrane-inserted)
VKDLTYKISKYPSTRRLSKSDVDSEIRKALDVWSAQTDLTFTEKNSGRVHIEIKFEKREHGDGDPFDGQERRRRRRRNHTSFEDTKSMESKPI